MGLCSDQIYYKLVKRYQNRYWSYNIGIDKSKNIQEGPNNPDFLRDGLRIEYVPFRWTKPTIAGTHLMCFSDVNQAFLNCGCSRIYYSYHVFRCLCKKPSKTGIFISPGIEGPSKSKLQQIVAGLRSSHDYSWLYKFDMSSFIFANEIMLLDEVKR